MKAKPGVVCQLEKGKLLDAQPGFVETFNWIASLCDELTKGNAKVETLEVLDGAEYDSGTHEFVVQSRKVRCIVLEVRDQESTVFEATALTGED